MARTQWGILYGTSNPHIIAHIRPDDDSELDAIPVAPGTKLLRIPYVHGEHTDVFHQRAHDHVASDAGVAQLSTPRMAVIDNNNVVVNVILGDISLNPHPNHISVSPSVKIGHVFDPINNNFIVPAINNPLKGITTLETRVT
jgi:hypothetical protein